MLFITAPLAVSGLYNTHINRWRRHTEVNFQYKVMLWFKCDEIIPGVAIGIAFVAVCLGGFFFVHDSWPVADVEYLCRYGVHFFVLASLIIYFCQILNACRRFWHCMWLVKIATLLNLYYSIQQHMWIQILKNVNDRSSLNIQMQLGYGYISIAWQQAFGSTHKNGPKISYFVL